MLAGDVVPEPPSELGVIVSPVLSVDFQRVRSTEPVIEPSGLTFRV